MLNFPGPEKILLLAIIALVVLGPTRLPAAARTAGKWVAELRKLTSRFQEEVSSALAEPKDALTAAVGDLRNEVGGWRSEMAGLTSSITASTSPTTWASASNGSIQSPTEAPHVPSTAVAESVSQATAPGLPPLPPVPDDPSLN